MRFEGVLLGAQFGDLLRVLVGIELLDLLLQRVDALLDPVDAGRCVGDAGLRPSYARVKLVGLPLPIAPRRREGVGALLPLSPGRLELPCGIVQLRALRVELRLPFGYLPFGIVQLRLSARTPARQLGRAAVVGRLAVGQPLLACGDRRGGIVELALRIVQLRLRVGPLALVVGTLLVELLLRIGLQLIDTCLLALGRKRLDAIRHFVYEPLVGVARRAFVRHPAHREVRLGIGKIGREVALGHVHILLDGARTQRGLAHARRRCVVRSVHKARHRVRARDEGLVHVLHALGDGQRVADGDGVVLHEVGRQHALPRLLRPRAPDEEGTVQIVGVVGTRMHAVGGVARARRIGQRMHARGVLFAVDRGHDVGLARGHHSLDSLDVAQRRDVVVGEAEGRKHADVHERRAVEVLVGRQLHIRRGHAQAGVEARAQRDDGGDGQEAPERVGDRTQGLSVERAFHDAPATTRSPRRKQAPRSLRRSQRVLHGCGSPGRRWR